MKQLITTLALVIGLAGTVEANIYTCVAISINDDSGEWSNERLIKWNPETIIKHYGFKDKSPTISRCSWSDIEGKRTCDTYPIDKREMTVFKRTNYFVDKFYYFRGHLDVQIFQPNGETSFNYIENNGRGAIRRGKCTLK